MSLSVFLATVLGGYLTIFSLSMLVHQKFFHKALHELAHNHGLSVLSGLFCLILGLVVIVSHSVWVLGWQLAVTLTGWGFFLQGVLRVLFPGAFLAYTKYLLEKGGFLLVSWVLFLVGLYLVWAGFTQ